MLAGMFASIRAGETGPGVVGHVWRALQKPNPWATLMEIGLSEIYQGPDLDPEPNTWWAHEEEEIPRNGYSLLAAESLASVEGVSGISLRFKLTF